ncbi:hypothetical protein J6590_042909 [Homalodisca vitripennis]|nr:hypothetical protein J6590_042909 [Homalodisca vitripennis]
MNKKHWRLGPCCIVECSVRVRNVRRGKERTDAKLEYRGVLVATRLERTCVSSLTLASFEHGWT